MFCLYQIGRTATPMQCTSSCPFRQKHLTWFHIDSILEKKYLIPHKYCPDFLDNYHKLRQNYRFIGHYQVECTQWNLLVDETVRYVVLKDAYNITEINEAISLLNTTDLNQDQLPQ